MNPKSRSIIEHDSLPHPKVRARRYDTAVTGPLSDDAIFDYALAGHYGLATQQWAQKLLAQRRALKRASQPRTFTDKVKNLLADLDL